MDEVKSINRLIAEALGIEHVTWQEGYYKEQQAEHGYVGHNRWITLLDGDELWGEIFPNDWEHDLNAAWPLIGDLGGLQTIRVISELPLNPQQAALMICMEWLNWKGVRV